MIIGQTSIWKAWPRHAQEKEKRGVIVVKNNYYDAVWLRERRMNCEVLMILYMWIVVLLASSVGWRCAVLVNWFV